MKKNYSEFNSFLKILILIYWQSENNPAIGTVYLQVTKYQITTEASGSKNHQEEVHRKIWGEKATFVYLVKNFWELSSIILHEVFWHQMFDSLRHLDLVLVAFLSYSANWNDYLGLIIKVMNLRSNQPFRDEITTLSRINILFLPSMYLLRTLKIDERKLSVKSDTVE